ncbi:MAG: thioredoxin domain-containing protein [Deltaproteobacteria bacterium]|nr:thioredoxin domain-containing protein [Deltaproteobacteria bacterium]
MSKSVKLIIFPVIGLIVLSLFAGYFIELRKKQARLDSLPSNLLRKGNYAKGTAGAKVLLVEFFDPECESCAAFHPAVKKILTDYPKDIEFVARYMLYHGNSEVAALALEGAGKQNKYWEMYDILLERSEQWGHLKESAAPIFEKYAQELGLNIEEFNKSYADPALKAKLTQDISDGKALGVKGTPTFFVNGKLLQKLSYSDLKNEIEVELAK